MEDALRELQAERMQYQESCLNPCSNGRCSASETNALAFFRIWVLILVLVKDTLRVRQLATPQEPCHGLNPCSNGRCSARHSPTTHYAPKSGLNPCSNGRCSARDNHDAGGAVGGDVLILVLMEDALRVLSYDWTPEEIERS